MSSNILILVNDIHFKGGGERVASYIASWYSKKNYNVTILSMSIKKNESIYPLDQNVKVEYLNVVNNVFFAKVLVFKRLNSFFSKRTINISIGIGTYANVLLGLLSHKVGITIGCEHNSFDSVSLIWRLLRTCFYRKLSATTVLTKTDLNKMSRLNKNTYVIPNSVPLQCQYSSLTEKKILAVGKFYEQKGFDIMLDVCADFFKIHPEWHLDIVGDGPDKKKLSDKIRNLRLEKNVTIQPFTENIEKAYLSSSIYLMTSRYEGLPMVLLEAQSYGIPIVSYDCNNGPRDIIVNGENGFLVRMGDKSSMIEALNLLAKDINIRKQMGSNSVKNSYNYSPVIIFSLWDKLFKSLL